VKYFVYFVDGQWGKWSYWNTCSRSCGGGIRQRIRNCNNPKPAFGGKSCIGPMLETQQCNSKSCGIGKHVTMDLIHYEVMTCLSADYNRLTKFDKSYFCCFEITCFSDICVIVLNILFYFTVCINTYERFYKNVDFGTWHVTLQRP